MLGKRYLSSCRISMPQNGDQSLKAWPSTFPTDSFSKKDVTLRRKLLRKELSIPISPMLELEFTNSGPGGISSIHTCLGRVEVARHWRASQLFLLQPLNSNGDPGSWFLVPGVQYSERSIWGVSRPLAKTLTGIFRALVRVTAQNRTQERWAMTTTPVPFLFPSPRLLINSGQRPTSSRSDRWMGQFHPLISRTRCNNYYISFITSSHSRT